LESASKWLIAYGRPSSARRLQRPSTLPESLFELSQVPDWTDPQGLI
jgi:hypothetical protein